MKNLLLLLTITFIPFLTFGQNTDSISVTNSTVSKPLIHKDTTRMKFAHKMVLIIQDKDSLNHSFDTEDEDFDEENDYSCMNFGHKGRSHRFNSHFAGIELGLNSYLNSAGKMLLSDDNRYMELDDSKSLEFSLNLFDFAIPIVKDRLGIVTGLGFSWNNYKFDNKQLVLQNDQPQLYVDTVLSPSYSKNKLTTMYLNVPLMLEFQQRLGHKQIWLLVGGYGGVKLSSHTKLKTTSGDKSKSFKDFHLNTLRYGLRAQVGVNDFGFYCNYALQTLFKNHEGPELYPISMGVTFAF